MHIEKREDPLVDMGYEVRDVNLRAITNATLIFLAFSVLSAVAGGVIYYYMSSAFHTKTTDDLPRQLPAGNNPLLQDNISAKADIMVLRRREAEALNGPPSQNKDGSFRIPIEAAMKMVAEQGGKTQGVREDVTVGSTKPDVAIEPSRLPAEGGTTPSGGTP